MRPENWGQLLAEFIEERRGMPFAWGSNDCALFAADWVKRLTLVDPAKHFRGYSTAQGAMLSLARNGTGELVSTWSLRYGAPLENARMAQRGDLCAIESGEGPAMGVCLGEKIAVVTPEGMAFVPIDAALHAWKV